MSYDGITCEGRMLLAENRFNNSKLFYDENKEKLKQLTTVPARQLASLMSETLLAVDPFICTDPVKMVSRIRRDTRFTHDKTLYRENMWIMFMRPKKAWRNQPCMWFEFYPDRFSYGVGMFDVTTEYREQFRKLLREEPEEFKSCAARCVKAGAPAQIEPFKKKYPGCPDETLLPYYNAKYLCFMHTDTDMQKLEDERIADELRCAIKQFAPMYKYLLKITETMTAQGL